MDKQLIFNDFKFLISHTQKIINNTSLNNSEKGLAIITAYSAANSLYEKFVTIILNSISESYTNDLRSNSKKIVLLKYRNGKKLNNMNKKEIDEFIKNIKGQEMAKEFVDAHKSLKEIKQVFLLIKIPEMKISKINKILNKRQLTLFGLQEQLEENYTNDRTKIIHGDFKDFLTVYFLFRSRYLDFLINLYIAMKIIDDAEYL